MKPRPQPHQADGAQLTYAKQSWTTAVHLEAALSRLTTIDVFGPGHPHPSGPSRATGWPLIWVEAGLPWLPDVHQLLASPTCAWLIDTHRGWRWRAELARAFTTVFVAQRDAVALFRQVGVQARWLPLAVPSELSGPGPDLADRPFDVALVGQAPAGTIRARLLAELAGRFTVAPTAGWLDPGAMMDLYRSARIVLNPPLARDLNMRAFEALGARALLVTGPMKASREVLGDLPIVVQSHDPRRWDDVIGAALGDPDAQARADRGFEHVVAHHTYDHRAGSILQALAARQGVTRDEQTVARALAYAHARWGDVTQTWALAHDPQLTATAAAWATATAIKHSFPINPVGHRLSGVYRKLRA